MLLIYKLYVMQFNESSDGDYGDNVNRTYVVYDVYCVYDAIM